jgi:hypothetical protein
MPEVTDIDSVDETKTLAAVLPFIFEARGQRCDDLIIQCIPGCRLRSAINGMAPVVDSRGHARVPLDQARALAAFPATPGMQLHVDPGACTYKIVDPLHGNEKALEDISMFFREQGQFSVADRITGKPPTEGKLDVHRMKSLCRELYNIVESKYGVFVKGIVKLADIEDLPGKFLLNPGSQVPNTQPIYEEEFPAWVENLSRSGG